MKTPLEYGASIAIGLILSGEAQAQQSLAPTPKNHEVGYVVTKCAANPIQSETFVFTNSGNLLTSGFTPTGVKGCSTNKQPYDLKTPSGPELQTFSSLVSSDPQALCDGNGAKIEHSKSGRCATWCDPVQGSPTFGKTLVGVPVPKDRDDHRCMANPFFTGASNDLAVLTKKAYNPKQWENLAPQIILTVTADSESGSACINYHSTPRPNLPTDGCVKFTDKPNASGDLTPESLARVLCSGVRINDGVEAKPTQLLIAQSQIDLCESTLPQQIKNSIATALGWEACQ